MSQELIAANYPKVGPYSSELIESAGNALIQLVRFLNYATLGEHRRDSLPYASHGYRLTGSLRAAAELQQQLHDHLARWCYELAADPVLGHDEHHGDELNHIVAMHNAEEAAEAFRDAVGHAAALNAALEKAHAALSPLYHNTDHERP